MMLEIKVVLATLLAALMLWSYHWVGESAVDSYKDSQAILQAKVDAKQQEKYNAIAEDYETLKAKREAAVKVRTKIVEKIVEREVYRNVCVDDEGVETMNKALRGEL
jgi:hypothetical protein